MRTSTADVWVCQGCGERNIAVAACLVCGMSNRQETGAINLRRVPLPLFREFGAVCALLGTNKTKRLLELIEQDVRENLHVARMPE